MALEGKHDLHPLLHTPAVVSPRKLQSVIRHCLSEEDSSDILQGGLLQLRQADLEGPNAHVNQLRDGLLLSG
jgi:hypothetical protein